MYVVEYVAGLFIVLVTVVSVLFILVLPRQPQGLEKLTVIVNKSVHYSFVMFARMAKTYEVKDSILAPTAPVALIAQLLWWAVCLIVGFALMLMNTTHSFAHGLTQAGTATDFIEHGRSDGRISWVSRGGASRRNGSSTSPRSSATDI